MNRIEFLDEVVLRCPARPIRTPQDEKEVLNYFQNPFAREALFTASESLYNEYQKWEEGKLNNKRKKRMLRSLYKYYLRIHSRSTPFGLLASVGVIGQFLKGSNYQIQERKRNSIVDVGCIRKIIEEILKEVAVYKYLNFTLNTSMILYKDKLRYLKVEYKETGDEVKACTINSNSFFKDLILFTKEYRSFAALSDFVGNYTRNSEEIEPYIIALVRKQILVSELEISLNSEDHLSQLIETLKKVKERSPSIRLNYWIAALVQLKIRLIRIDKRSVNRPSAYKAIDKCIENMGAKLESRKNLHIDSSSDITIKGAKHLEKFPLKQLELLINILSSNKKTAVNKSLKSYKEKFKRRYGENPVPLAVLMDPELGLGYGNNSDIHFHSSILINRNLISPRQQSKNGRSYWKSDLLKRAYNKIEYEVEMELNTPKNKNHLRKLPASFSVILSIVKDHSGKRRYLIKEIGGCHAFHYIGRFCHQNLKLKDLAKTIAEHEEYVYSDKELTEFYHQSHMNSCNILSRPQLFKNSFHYLNNKGDGKSNLQDLHIILKDEEFVLFNSEDGRKILPRISSAHDHKVNTLPLYEFIGDLQSQSITDNLGFDWGDFSSSNFYPRVRYKDFIVKTAEWRFKSAEVLKENYISDSFKAWREMFNVPEIVLFSDSDRELIIDFGSDLGTDLFCQILKENQEIVLTEFFFPDDEFLVDKNGKTLSNEIILFVKNHSIKSFGDEDITGETCLEGPREQGVVATDDWVYLKLYCNQNHSDKILERISFLINKLIRSGLIDKWFFVRFRDPDHHLRVRLHLINKKERASLLNLLTDFATEQIDEDLGWKFTFESYQKELGRYGASSMEIAESLFYHDSEAYQRFNRAFDNRDKVELRWQLGLLFIHDLFELFRLDISCRIHLLKKLCESAKAEFKIGKLQKTELAISFRDKRFGIQNLLNDCAKRSSSQKLLVGITAERSLKMQKGIDDYLRRNKGEAKFDFMLSIMHMSMNRLFVSMPRFQEFVVYDLILNHYSSMNSRILKSRDVKA